MISNPSGRTEPSRSNAVFWVVLTVSILAIKIVFLAVDSLPLFFFGDSGAYLHSAVTFSAPTDRSFTYGMAFIRPVLAVFGTVRAVVVIQSLLACVTSVLAAACLRVGFRAPLWIGALAALLYTVEPLALIYERLIMTETLALFFFAWFVLTGLCYINRPRVSLLIALAFLGTCVLSLRSFYIPVVLISTVVAVLLATPPIEAQSTGGSRGFRSRLLLHALVAIGATLCFHALHQMCFSYLTKVPPAYNAGDGFFLLAAWSPLVIPDDFPSKGMADRDLPNLKFDLENRFTRANQLYSEGGLIEIIKKEEGGDLFKANRLAKKIALHACLRDPIGLVGLALRTYGDFWDKERMKSGLTVAQGQLEMDQELLDHFRVHYSEDLSGHHLQDTLAKRWHRSAIPWYRLLLLSPFFSALLCIPRPHRAQAIFIGVIVCAVFVVATALVTGPIVRYLHAIAWLTCIQLGILLCHLRAVWRQKARQT